MFWFHLISTCASPFIPDCQKSISRLQLVQNAVARILTEVPEVAANLYYREDSRVQATERYSSQICRWPSSSLRVRMSLELFRQGPQVKTQWLGLCSLGCLKWPVCLEKMMYNKIISSLKCPLKPHLHTQAFNVIRLYCLCFSIFLDIAFLLTSWFKHVKLSQNILDHFYCY